VKLLLWLILLVLCWPVAVDAVFRTLHAILLLPARVLRGPRG
jgi:hypothetical protein